MYDDRRAIRAAIKRMSRREATAWVKSLELHEEEERAIMLCDVEGLSVVAASFKMNCSREMVSHMKAKAYDRINRDTKGKIPE